MQQNKAARSGADHLMATAGVSNRVIASPIILAIDVHDAFEHETLLRFWMVVLGIDTAGLHPHQARAHAGHRIDMEHLQRGPRRDFEPHAFRLPARDGWRPSADALMDRRPGG